MTSPPTSSRRGLTWRCVSRGSAQPAISARKLATSHDVVCASPAYLRRCGSPGDPGDLGRHICIGYTYAPASNEWRFTHRLGDVRAVRIKSAMHDNSCHMARAAALAGVGIILQPLFMVSEDLQGRPPCAAASGLSPSRSRCVCRLSEPASPERQGAGDGGLSCRSVQRTPLWSLPPESRAADTQRPPLAPQERASA